MTAEPQVGDRVALRGTIREITHGTAIVAIDKADTGDRGKMSGLVAVDLDGLGRLVPLIVDLTPNAQEAIT